MGLFTCLDCFRGKGRLDGSSPPARHTQVQQRDEKRSSAPRKASDEAIVEKRTSTLRKASDEAVVAKRTSTLRKTSDEAVVVEKENISDTAEKTRLVPSPSFHPLDFKFLEAFPSNAIRPGDETDVGEDTKTTLHDDKQEAITALPSRPSYEDEAPVDQPERLPSSSSSSSSSSSASLQVPQPTTHVAQTSPSTEGPVSQQTTAHTDPTFASTEEQPVPGPSPASTPLSASASAPASLLPTIVTPPITPKLKRRQSRLSRFLSTSKSSSPIGTISQPSNSKLNQQQYKTLGTEIEPATNLQQKNRGVRVAPAAWQEGNVSIEEEAEKNEVETRSELMAPPCLDVVVEGRKYHDEDDSQSLFSY